MKMQPGILFSLLPWPCWPGVTAHKNFSNVRRHAGTFRQRFPQCTAGVTGYYAQPAPEVVRYDRYLLVSTAHRPHSVTRFPR